jgi:hypothetical protein
LRNSHGIGPGVGEGGCLEGTATHGDAAEVETGRADAELG